ncbi:RDD family protein [Peribacillus kribbensis]|uniref:RDD family protein n=1 Tax=Peribacillus kribbensis TaxID=356658 RepID=UPI00041362AD|nr:RDD family protein [Peribacillus kribbensis]
MSHPGGFWRRFAASVLDAIVVSITLGTIGYLIFGNWDKNPISQVGGALYSILIPVVWQGYTVGKRVLNVRIVKLNGEKLGFGTMLIRTLAGGLIYGLTLGAALVVSAFMVGLRKDKRAIHDFIAGTYVTTDPPVNRKEEIA